MTGASLAFETVRSKVTSTGVVPSDTVTVIVVVPVWLARGVTVSVRGDVVPVIARLASGTSASFDDTAEITNDGDVSGVSTSL